MNGPTIKTCMAKDINNELHCYIHQPLIFYFTSKCFRHAAVAFFVLECTVLFFMEGL